MRVAEHARQLPCLAGLSPYHGEFHHAAILFSILLVTEAMFTDFDRTVTRSRIDFERSGHQVPVPIGHVGAYLYEVLLSLREVLHAAAAVVELQIVGEKGH